MPIDTSPARIFMDRVRQTVYAAMNNRADITVGEIKDAISDPYPPASEPFSPPHLRTGNLREGVQQITVESGDVITSHIGSERQEGDPRVPAFLEFGTSKMEPRPYMGPAFHESPPKFRADVVSALQALAQQ